MINLVEKTKTQRKTFTIPKYIIKELEEYAKANNKKQSQIVALALESFLNNQKREKKVEKRLKAFENLLGILPRGSTKNQKIQDMLYKEDK